MDRFVTVVEVAIPRNISRMVVSITVLLKDVTMTVTSYGLVPATARLLLIVIR